MNSSTEVAALRRVAHAEALRDLIATVRSERAWMPANSDERDFSLGIESAANAMLHPERSGAMPVDWLDRESPVFREGYEQTMAMLAAAMTLDPPPRSLWVPVHGSTR